MRHIVVFASILGMAAAGLLPAERAMADSVSIGVRTESLNLGVNIGEPPRLVVVPGTPVYHAPSVNSNYFFYSGGYYLYHGGAWYFGAHHNGPWTVVALQSVPQPILAVPVQYYRAPPGHWKTHGPPPWAEAHGYSKDKRHDKAKRHGKYKHKKKEKDD